MPRATAAGMSATAAAAGGPPPLRVVVAGAGFGGTAAALALLHAFPRHLPLVVDLVGGAADAADAADAGPPARGMGIWNQAQAILARIAPPPPPGLQRHIRPAAYRSRTGTWLSQARDTPFNATRVATFVEQDLLAHLRGALAAWSQPSASSSPHHHALRLHPDAMVVGHDVLSDGGDSHQRRLVRVHLETAASADSKGRPMTSTLDANVLVAADGLHSTVRNSLLQRRAVAAAPGRHTVPPTPSFQSEIAYSFISPHELSPALAFETLAQGRRFAAVPLPRGTFCFASLPGTWIRPAEPRATSLSAGRRQELMEALAGPLYGDWHEPIPSLVRAAAAAGASVRADPSFDMGPQPLSADAASLTAFVGDAGHVLPFNLAQGASLAIEDADCLAAALIASAAAGTPADIPAALEAYAAARRRRYRQCRRITQMTRAIAAPRGPVEEALRNAMRLVPQPLNSMIFDACLDYSMPAPEPDL